MDEKDEFYGSDYRGVGRFSLPIMEFREIKSKLGGEDIISLDGKRILTYPGWVKVGIYFGVSHEIKGSERVEFERGGKKFSLWRYSVRVRLPSGISAEAEGVASSDEPIAEGKTESFVSSLAQKRAFCRALSMLVGGGEISAEDVEILKRIPRQRKISGELDDEEKAQEVEKWEEKERKIEKEMEFYSDAMKGEVHEVLTDFSSGENTNSKQKEMRGDDISSHEVLSSSALSPNQASETEVFESSTETERDVTSGTQSETSITQSQSGGGEVARSGSGGALSRRELINMMQAYMNRLGLNTHEKRREYVSQVLGRKVKKSAELTEEELKLIVKRLRSDLAMKKVS